MDWLKNLGRKVGSIFSGGRRDEEEERRRQQPQQRQIQQQRAQAQRPQPTATQSPFGLRSLGQPTQPRQPIPTTPSIKGLDLKKTEIQTPAPKPVVRKEAPQSPLGNPVTKADEDRAKRINRNNITKEDRNQAFQNINRTGDIRIDAPRAHQEALRVSAARRNADNKRRQQASLDTIPFQGVRGTIHGAARSGGTLPGTAVQLVGTTGKFLSPDNTAIDNFFENLRTKGRSMNESVNKSLDKSFGSGQGKVGIANQVGQGVGQIAADVATGKLLGSALGWAGSGMEQARNATGLISARYGAEEANEQFDAAKEAGKSDLNSGGIATGAGITTAALEKVGLDKLLRPGTSNKAINAVKRFFTEGAQEGAQELGSNAWEKYGYNPDKELGEGVGEAALIGGLTGSVTSPGIDFLNNRQRPTSPPEVEAQRVVEDAQKVQRTNQVPRTEAELQSSIDNGVITPLSRNLSVDQKITLLENSPLNPAKDIAQGYRENEMLAELAGNMQNREVRYRDSDNTLNSLNPTGTVMTDYSPQTRANARLGANMTTLADTAGQSPDSIVTVYRGVPEGAEASINPGDFITTNAQLAQDYAGGGRVVQEQVRFGDIIDDHTEPLGEEYIFRPGADRELFSDVRHRELEERIALGLESGTISPEQAQALQLENARMFGEASDTLRFVDGVQGNENALGATIDNLDDSSTIQLDNRQDDRTAQDTYFHEAVHKVLNDYSTEQERAQVIRSYIDDKLIDVDSIQLREGETINDVIEERVAEDFIYYVADIKNKQSRGNRLTRAIRNFFDTVFKRFQQDVWRRAQGGTLEPAYKKLYEDLYDGVYAKRDVQDKSLRAGDTAKSLQLEETISNLQQAFDNERNSATRDAISRDIANLQQELNAERKASGRVASPAHRFRQDEGVSERYSTPTKFTHETNAKWDKFDMSKIGTGQGDAWLGKGMYLQKEGSFKLETYGKHKKDFTLAPGAKVFEGDIVRYAKERRVEGWNIRNREANGLNRHLPRDVFKGNYELVEQLKKDGYDGYLDDGGELVMYNPDKLIPIDKANSYQSPSLASGPVRYRRPAVQPSEIKSDDGIKITKTDFNNALDEVIYQREEPLMQKRELLEHELQGLKERDAHGELGGAIRPQDAEWLFGKNYSQFIPRNNIRKDAAPWDQQARDRGFDDPDAYADHIRRPLEVRKEIQELNEQIDQLYANKEYREEAKLLAEVRAAEKQEVQSPTPETPSQTEVEQKPKSTKDRILDFFKDMGERQDNHREEQALLKDDKVLGLEKRVENLTKELNATDDYDQKAQKVVRDELRKVKKELAAEKKRRSEIDKRLEREKRLDEVREGIQRGFEAGPRLTIEQIVRGAAEHSYVRSDKVREMIKDYADKHGYDISSGRAIKKPKVSDADLTILNEDGSLKDYKDIQAAAKKALSQKKKSGIREAQLAMSSLDNPLEGNLKQMVSTDKDGNTSHFFEWRTTNKGKWHRVGQVPVSSINNALKTEEVFDNATVNAEAKRAFDSGESYQYIWRENDTGVNSEFVTEFDASVGDNQSDNPNKLVLFDPDKHYIEAGKVVVADTGQILGNYIEITPDAVKIYSGSQVTNINPNDLDFTNVNKVGIKGGITLTTQEYLRRMFSGRKSYKGAANQMEYVKSGGHKTQEILTDLLVRDPQRALLGLRQDKMAINETQEYHERQVKKAMKGMGKKKFKEMQQDTVYLIEPVKPKKGEPKPPSYDERLKQFEEKWGKQVADAVDAKNKFQRAMYDNLLTRMNIERLKIGKPEIKRRNDYIMHTAEMLDNGILARAKSLLDTISNPSSGDVAPESRGSLPARLAGRSSMFKPKSRYNASEFQRLADSKPTDPDLPFRLYADTALENIHMTQPTTQIRTMETYLRGMSEASTEYKSRAGIDKMTERIDNIAEEAATGKVNPEQAKELRNKWYGLNLAFKDIPVEKGFARVLRKIEKSDGTITPDDQAILVNTAEKATEFLNKKADDIESLNENAKETDGMSQLVTFVQEQANKFAGKTNAWTRTDKDSYGDSGLTDRVVRGMQQHSAISQIVGNVSTVLAQTIAIPHAIGTTPPSSWRYGIENMNNGELFKKSNAMVLRYNDATLRKQSRYDKAMKFAGMPLEKVEQASLKAMWAMKYHQAIQRGLTERQAVDFSDTFINDNVSFRDASQTARIYDHAVKSAPLQYTREVTQARRGIWNTMDKKEKVGWMVANSILLTGLEALVGRKMGIDPLGAILETTLAALGAEGDEEDENNPWKRAARVAQIWASELASGDPITSAAINNSMSKDLRADVFGTDSDFGRYDGAMAMFSQVGNTGKALISTAKGNYDQAWKDAVKLLPVGGQVSKTASGVQAMSRGYTTTSSGNIRTAVDKSNPLNWLLATAFGPNVIAEQRKSFDSGKTLGTKNSETAKMLKGEDRREFVQSMSESKGTTEGSALPSNLASLAKIFGFDGGGSKATESPALGSDIQGSEATAEEKAEFTKAQANAKAKVTAGDWKMEDGVYVDKDGKPIKAYYRTKANALKGSQSEKAYEAWAYGYGLEAKSSKSTTKTGIESLDRLIETDPSASQTGRSNATLAQNLMLGKGNLSEVPDWVKDKFYKKAGFTKNDVAYRAMTSMPSESRLKEYKRIAEEGDKKKFLDALHEGRRMAIGNGYMMLQDKMITQLRDEGYITKEEAKVLKSYKLVVKDGKLVPTEDSKKISAGVRSGGGRRGGGKAKTPDQLYTAQDIKNFMSGGDPEVRSSLLRIASGSTPSMSVGKVRARRATTRNYRGVSSNRRKTAKTSIG